MKKNPHDIIQRPVITEHSSELQTVEAPQYVFEVASDANKIEIRQAVEEIFGVKVAKVNTIVRKGKVKRVRMKAGKRADVKRAFVVLHPGQTIELY